MEWRIINSKGLYWNNDYGWTGEDHDIFSDEERNTLRLPHDGKWEEHKKHLEFAGFSVIFTAEIPMSRSVKHYRPKSKKWVLTENHWDDDGDSKMKHRKWCAWLSPEEFEKWIKEIELYPSAVETMGSLGGMLEDGFTYGLQPAISFDENYEFYTYGVSLNAYVTPYPKISSTPLFPELEVELTEEMWQRVRKEIFEKYS